MNSIYNMDLVELELREQQQITGGMRIGSLSITASIITEESEITETKSFSIHWDESGVTFRQE